MAQYTFTDSDGKKFTVKGPESLTEAQAKEIFDKQSNTGALTGLKPGDLLDSAKQALGGVTGAIGSALQSVTAGISGQISGITNALSSGLPSSPIGLGDLAKSAQGVAKMAGIPPTAVTAGLAAAQKLVNQPSSVLSDSKGLGSFGLDVKQLETSGFVKPGTSNILNKAGATVSNVLGSPTVWTGKDGISSADSMLSNPSVQGLTQQNLMSTGLQGLSTLGVSTSGLTPPASIGAALNAAKSIPGAAAWAKGVGLPTDLKVPFDQNAVAGAFGVNMSELKANAPMLEEEKITGSTNTVNRATVNAATKRIVGNPKIPSLDYTPSSSTDDAWTAKTLELNATLDAQFNKLAALGTQAVELNENATITQAQYDQLLSDQNAYRAFGKGTTQPMYLAWLDDYQSLSNSEQRAKAPIFNAIKARVDSIGALRDKVYKTIEDLLAKIA